MTRSLRLVVHRQALVLRTRLLWGWRFHGLGRRTLLGPCRRANNPGCVEIGAYVTLLGGWSLNDLRPDLPWDEAKIRIGNHCILQHDFQCNAAISVEIQDHVLAAARVLITDSDHIVDPAGERTTHCREFLSAPVVVEHDCWLGQNAVILKGVRVGHHSVVGANSVVVENVPPGSIVGGIPARVIGRTRSAG